jgi:hypothetical protein
LHDLDELGEAVAAPGQYAPNSLAAEAALLLGECRVQLPSDVVELRRWNMVVQGYRAIATEWTFR